MPGRVWNEGLEKTGDRSSQLAALILPAIRMDYAASAETLDELVAAALRHRNAGLANAPIYSVPSPPRSAAFSPRNRSRTGSTRRSSILAGQRFTGMDQRLAFPARCRARMTGRLAIKRVYAAPESSDGQRILVDRLWPRGVSRSDAAIDGWEKDVAPSPALRMWFAHDPARFPEFSGRYRAELDANPGPVDRLRDRLDGHDLTLVYAARDKHCNHARVLADYLASKSAG